MPRAMAESPSAAVLPTLPKAPTSHKPVRRFAMIERGTYPEGGSKCYCQQSGGGCQLSRENCPAWPKNNHRERNCSRLHVVRLQVAGFEVAELHGEPACQALEDPGGCSCGSLSNAPGTGLTGRKPDNHPCPCFRPARSAFGIGCEL